MGIQDRDDYQDHYRNVARLNRRRDSWSTGRVALFWIAVLAIAFSVMRLLPILLPAPSRPGPAPVTIAPAVPVSPQTMSTRSTAAQPFRPSQSTDAAPIYRCGNAYGLAPCTKGRAVEGPAASGFDSRPSEALTRLVAEGRSRGGDTVTTETRIVGGSNVGTCQALSAEIAEIDREARRPLPAPQQDFLRDNRAGWLAIGRSLCTAEISRGTPHEAPIVRWSALPVMRRSPSILMQP